LHEAVQGSADSSTASTLAQGEKAFLKVGKKVRNLVKLEGETTSGKALDKMQAKMLEGKYDLFLELSHLEKKLPLDSDLRSKNEELLAAVAAYLENPP